MTTPEKSEAIIKKIVEIANAGKTISFSDDWGGNSLTIHVDGSHTHIGSISDEYDTLENLVDDLYNTLHGGPGLSWVAVAEPAEPNV